MDETRATQLVVGAIVFVAGVLVTFAALNRLSTPALRALGERELRIMVGLLVAGVVVAVLGACEAAGLARYPSIVPAVVACLVAMGAGADSVRVAIESQPWLGQDPGPIEEALSSNWSLFLGAVLSGAGGILLPPARLGRLPWTKQDPVLPKPAADRGKTYHADRWWKRDDAGSVLVWNDQAQAWSPWVHGRDPELPPEWS